MVSVSEKDLSDSVLDATLYDEDGNLVTHLNGLTEVCVGHRLTDEESRFIDYLNSIPCQSFKLSFKKLPLRTRIRIKLHLLYQRFIGKYKYYRSSAK